jgi:50S ribosomal protein L16 3-hydroxylase
MKASKMIQINKPTPMLGGLTPSEFMEQYWQKKPLLIKAAFKDFKPVLSRAQLFELAGSNEVQSRLIERGANTDSCESWRVKHGPIKPKERPAFSKEGWTLLVQGVDLVSAQAARLLREFRFIPDARLDDLMISYATDQGGVGPHFDSYDVFLLQASGQRRWQIGRQKDLSLRSDVELKILEHFTPQKEYVLEPGDMLYLPPKYAHDGVAIGECMTYSIGFRAPSAQGLASELLARLADEVEDLVKPALYTDPLQSAVKQPAQIPDQLRHFAMSALASAIDKPAVFSRLLGEILSEPKDHVWFQSTRGEAPKRRAGKHPFPSGIGLDDQTKMLFDDRYIFINGEAWQASSRDKTLMRLLANERKLSPEQLSNSSQDAVDLLDNWIDVGWVHEMHPNVINKH